MPGYKATVVGENFEFVIDDESQYLDFQQTLYVDATDESAAQALALNKVQEALHAQALLDEQSDQHIKIDEINQVDVLGDDGEFLWYFSEEDFDENE